MLIIKLHEVEIWNVRTHVYGLKFQLYMYVHKLEEFWSTKVVLDKYSFNYNQANLWAWKYIHAK